MNEMRSSNVSGFDQAAPTLRSAQIAVLGCGHDAGHRQTPGAVRPRPAMEIAVQEALPTKAPRWSASTRPGTLFSRVVAALSEPGSQRSLLGLLGMACRMVGTDALLAAAEAARPRWI
jgi:hypothetical protein